MLGTVCDKDYIVKNISRVPDQNGIYLKHDI